MGKKGRNKNKKGKKAAAATGKSCLIKRYCEERFVQRYISTIGVDFGVKPVTIYDYQVKVNFWDLSGHPEFFEVRNEFYKDTQGAMLVYDISSRKSFEALNMWVKEAAKFAGSSGNILKQVILLDGSGQRQVLGC